MSLYLGDIPIANDGSHRLTGEIGDMGFAPLGIDESLNLRRYLNGQVISQSLSPSFTTKVKQAIALFPNLGTTESNWQSEKTLSKLGQCGKFVIDDENRTIRLPAIVNAQGLLSLSAIGTIKDESLPNITGSNLVQASNTSGCFYGLQNANVITAAGTGIIWGTGFNASLSSSTYQDNAPVQQEAVQYPYYIQIATGVEETLPAIREYEINTPFFFGQSMYSENAPYNASWLASNGSYNASTLYPDFWTQLTGVELNTSLNVGDTIEISGKTYVKRGLPVVLSTGAYTDYDFVINTSDQTFRLPLLNGEEDLPGKRTLSFTVQPSGTNYNVPANGWVYVSGVPSTTNAYIDIYSIDDEGNSHCHSFSFVTVANYWPSGYVPVKKGWSVNVRYANMQQAGQTYPMGIIFTYATGNGTLYYYVGDTVQDSSLINAGAALNEIANLKTNKADIDASNFNASGRSLLSGLGMPSSHYENWTLGASGTQYTAPANGYIQISKYSSGGGQALNISISKFYTGTGASDSVFIIWSTGASQPMALTFPLSKGDKFFIYYDLGGVTNTFKFIYAEGEN